MDSVVLVTLLQLVTGVNASKLLLNQFYQYYQYYQLVAYRITIINTLPIY